MADDFLPQDLPELTNARLRELLDYNPETGVFRWKARTGRSAKGNVAGSVRNSNSACFGYRYIRVDQGRYAAHRLAWFYVHGIWPKVDIDHRDMNRDNNRISNLREATRSQNMANRPRPPHNVSGLKGVSFARAERKWKAQIQFRQRTINLGFFDSAEEAHQIYCQKANELFGSFFRAT